MNFIKSTTVQTSGLAADCITTNTHVYFTSSYSGEVHSCDHDLNECNLVTNDSLLAPISFIGAMGIVHIKTEREEFLIVANPDAGKLVKVPVQNGVLNEAVGSVKNVDIPDANNVMYGSDGLVYINNSYLVSVTRKNVILYKSEDNWESAVIQYVQGIESIEGTGKWGGANAVAKRIIETNRIELYVTFPGYISWFSSPRVSQDTYPLAEVWLMGNFEENEKYSSDVEEETSEGFSLSLMIISLLWIA